MKILSLQSLLRSGPSTFRKLRRLSTRTGQPSRPSGFIEIVNLHEVSGWALRRDRRRELKLGLDGQVFVPSVTWHSRADVVEALKCEEQAPGFRALIPQRLRGLLAADLDAIDRLKVIVDDAEIGRADTVKVGRPARVRVDKPGPLEAPAEFRLRDFSPEAPDLRVRLDRIEGFTIYGSVTMPNPSVDGLAEPSIELRCAGETLESAVVLGGDPDDPAAQKFSHADTGVLDFEVELPGFLWEHADQDGACAVQLSIDGVTMPASPILINPAHAGDWIADIADGYFGERQYWVLLALEHLHFLGSELALDPDSAKFMEHVAEEHGLEEFLPGRMGDDAADTYGRSEVGFEQLLVWRAMRAFNDAVAQWQGREQDLVLEVFEEFQMAEGPRQWLAIGLVPYFCRIGRFRILREHVPQSVVDTLAASPAAWRASIAMPFLVHELDIATCTEILWRIPKSEGWINSECINYATQQILKARPGVFTPGEIQDYGYALVGLLDAMRADYWSRAHDVHLIESLTAFLHDGWRLDEWAGRDLAAAALRIYGMSPRFWGGICPDEIRRAGFLDELLVGRAGFERLQQLLAGPLDGRVMRDAWPLLEFLRGFRNIEAEAAQRELLANLLPGMASNPEGAEPLQPEMAMQLLSAKDALRVAAYPLCGENRFASRVPNLNSLIRSMSSVHARAPHYTLQRQAAAMLEELRRVPATIDATEIGKTIRPLLQAAAELNQKKDVFVGTDVLAEACAILTGAGQPTRLLLDSIRSAVATCLASASTYEWPPASLMTLAEALREAGMAGDRLARSLFSELAEQLGSHYDDRLGEITDAFAKRTHVEWQHAPGRDTLVVIYSCRKYLDSRIPPIVETWGRDLEARDIPYVVLVGDGDDTLRDKVLALDVSDRYEDLPKKTLKLIAWVAENTDFQYLVKIDDDCYLKVDEYFGSLSYRKHHYHGRIIEQARGGMDRVWHQDKAQGQRARRALEKSPEPARWADGGSGYSLSRLAMQVLLSTADTPEGRRLVHSSFMEDKLVGDLLQLGGVGVSDEDCYALVRRRTFGDALPVARWANGFFCSKLTPTTLVHLDTEKHLALAEKLSSGEEIWPKKIWPTYGPPALWFNSNQLELLTPTDKASELLQAELVVVAVLRNERVIVPHFLDHYRRLGVKSFIIVDNVSDDGTREFLFDQPDVVLYSADSEYRRSHYGVAWQQAVLANHCIGKWVLLADADEFLVYPGCETTPLADYVGKVDGDGYDAVCVLMVDMYPYGDLADADFQKSAPFDSAAYFDSRPVTRWYLGSGHYSNSENYVSALRHRQITDAEPNAFTSQKYCLLKYAPWMKFAEGLHSVAEISPAPDKAAFAHFKYHSEFKDKVETEIRRKQHFDGAKEYAKYRAMLIEGAGGFGAEGVSASYRGSQDFLEIVAGLPSAADGPDVPAGGKAIACD